MSSSVSIDKLIIFFLFYSLFFLSQLDGEKGDFVDPVPFQSAIINNLDGQAKFWIGKDYVNFIIKDLTNLDAPYVGMSFLL